MTDQKKDRSWTNKLAKPIRAVFGVFTFLLLVVALASKFKTVIIVPEISAYLLLISTLFGILVVLMPTNDNPTQRVRKRDYLFSVVLFVIAEMLLFLQFQPPGWELYIAMTFAGIIMLGLFSYHPDSGDQIEEKDFQLNVRSLLGLTLALIIAASALASLIGLLAFRVIFGGFILFFFSGYTWTYLLFNHGDIDAVERVLLLSIVFSMVIMPVSLFYLSRVGLPITLTRVLSVSLIACLLGLLVHKYKNVIARVWKGSKKAE
jgi:hypothetical protein